jgi:hypothetical protein
MYSSEPKKTKQEKVQTFHPRRNKKSLPQQQAKNQALFQSLGKPPPACKVFYLCQERKNAKWFRYIRGSNQGLPGVLSHKGSLLVLTIAPSLPFC